MLNKAKDRKGNIKTRVTWALADSGSDREGLSEKLVHNLDIPYKEERTILTTIKGSESIIQKFVNFEICSLNQETSIMVENGIVGTVFCGKSEKPPTPSATKQYPHLNEVNIIDIGHLEVECLLSSKLMFYWMGPTIMDTPSLPIAMYSNYFGWTIFNMTTNIIDTETNNHISILEDKSLIGAVDWQQNPKVRSTKPMKKWS